MSQDILEERLSACDFALESGRRFGMVLELSADTEGGGEAAKRVRAWLNAHGEQLTQRCVGIAFVIDKIALRFIISTSLLVIGKPVPYKVFSTVDEARRWLSSAL